MPWYRIVPKAGNHKQFLIACGTLINSDEMDISLLCSFFKDHITIYNLFIII